MRKISEDLLLDIAKMLKRYDKAMNVLERQNNNKIIYPELKKDGQALAERIEDQYGLREYTDPMARDKMLEKAKKDAGQ